MLKKQSFWKLEPHLMTFFSKWRGKKGGWDSYPSDLHCKCNAIPGDLPSKFTMSENT